MNISFAWTTDALRAGVKACTRRHWTPDYASRFEMGAVHNAYDRSPRYGGKSVAFIVITHRPYLENTAFMPEEDYEAEGLGWMERNGLLIRGQHPRQFWEAWREAAESVYVVRFRLVRLEDA